MVVCAACLAESVEGSRFCAACGRPLTVPAAGPTRVEERKVVSVLFCDLVGFTAASEHADPEDVALMLDRYAAMARSAIRSQGGVVEKFIGDAAVGVFGVPATHEDDALRAIRAGLAICSAAADAGLRLRVGINTGEALVRLDVVPDSGERFMTGDAVNTASRIQSVAPELGVAVGEATWRATRRAVDAVELPPATLKGKAEPVRVFHAVAIRETTTAGAHGGAFVGRTTEIEWLRTAFDRAIRDRQPTLLLVSGEPGIGKSRIVAELRRHVEATAPEARWYQGRCLPYGDGITFWALGEVVKAHAGILEGDGPVVAGSKLEAALAGFDDPGWLEARLRPLVGISGSAQPPSRAEAFSAWRSFLAALASDAGAVIVVEDIHWADDALLEFLAALAPDLAGVPLVVVATCRPELFGRASLPPGIGGATRLDLVRLPDDEAEQLVGDLLGAIVPQELRDPILARAEGNPLFAEEYVRLLIDRGLVIEEDGVLGLAHGASLPIPDSIGALLAARLDTLPPPRKALLGDASVVGETFWSGTIAAMGRRDRRAVTSDLADLTRLDFVREVVPSSMTGEDESAFWHALGRDVAYAQLTRSARAERHLAAARWLEAKAGDRVEDVAELLAHHYTTALDLAEATGNDELAAATRPAAVSMLGLAGDRALNLDTGSALAAYERALALMGEDDPDRARATRRLAAALFHAGRYEPAAEAFRDALERYEAAGDLHAAALTKIQLSRALQWMGPPHWELIEEAVAVLEADGPSPDLVYGLGTLSFVHLVFDRPADAVATADRAIDLARQLGLPPPAAAFAWRGSTRCLLGDVRGLEDGRVAIALATAAQTARDAAIFRNEYAANVYLFRGGPEAEEAALDVVDYAARRGLQGIERLGRSGLAALMMEQGRIDEAEAAIRAALAALEAAGDASMVPAQRADLIRLATLRGETATASALASATESDPHLEDGSGGLFIVTAIARAYAEAGDATGAARLLRRLDAARTGSAYRGAETLDAVIAALTVGDRDLAARLVDASTHPSPFYAEMRRLARALVAEANGDRSNAATAFRTAAAALVPFSIPMHAQALLGLGRCLVALGRPLEAIEPLTTARDLAVRMGARPWVTEADTLLAQLQGIETPAG